MNATAYWISPKGKIYELKTGLHIDYVIKYPIKFGESKQAIKDTYEKYGENMPHEGKAREEIMTRILMRGYIRIREFNRGGRWSIQLNKMTSRVSDILWEWAKTIYKNVVDKYADVTIHELSNNKMTKTSFNELAESSMRIILDKHLMTEDNEPVIEFVSSVQEFDDFV
jgi:hypothetical protein